MRHFWWIPNLLTGVRIVLGPVILLIIIWEFLSVQLRMETPLSPEKWIDVGLWAFALTAVCVFTDLLDGWLARTFSRYGWETPLGRHWDPLADKWFGLAIAFAVPLKLGVGAYLLPYIACGIYIIWYSHQTSRMRWRNEIDKPNKIAQQKTALLMVVKVIFMTAIVIDERGHQWWAEWLIFAGCILLVAVMHLCMAALRKYKADAPRIAARA